MRSLAILALLSAPTLVVANDFDEALRGASRRSGLWVVNLDQTQQALFPYPVVDLYLNIATRVYGAESPIRTEMVDWSVGLYGMDSRIQWLVGKDRVFLADNQIEFDSRLDPDVIGVRVGIGLGGDQFPATISFRGKTAHSIFRRPEAGHTKFEGEWVATALPQPYRHVYEGAVLHLRRLGSGESVASFDKFDRTTATFGIFCTGGTNDDRTLHMFMGTGASAVPALLEATFDETAGVLNASVLRSYLSASAFRRIDGGWYIVERAPWSTEPLAPPSIKW